MENRYMQTDLQKIVLKKEYSNQSILDIGGGGEGFIGKLYGSNVIAIDKREDELNETNNQAIKLVMDGRKLAFTDENFDVVTLFYSLMYMSKETQKQVISEAKRVMKNNGIIDIWDIEIPKYEGGDQDIFVAQLQVDCLGELISTGYGVGLGDEAFTKAEIENLLNEQGFIKLEDESNALSYRLKYMKSHVVESID